MPFADDSGHKVWVDGPDGTRIDVSDLEERVGAAPCAAFAVDDLTDPPTAFMRLPQHGIAYADLQKDRIKRRTAGDCRHRRHE